MKYLKQILTVAICLAAIIGDYIVFKSKFSQFQVFRAFSDSLVHLSIGFLSSLLFFSYEMNVNKFAYIMNVLFCTFMSSVIDIDHVFVAKSFMLKDMTNLKQRGIFHCTTFWLSITSLLLLYSYVAKKLNIYMLTFMLIIAYTSHHIRDANRRGLWLYPFGHTPPIAKAIYVSLIAILPHIFAYLYKCTEEAMYKHTVITFKMGTIMGNH